MRRLLSADGNVLCWFDDVPGEDGFVVQHVANEIPVLEHNKALQNHDDGYSPTREMRRAASIPDIIALKWLTEEGLNLWDRNHWRGVRRKLNDPEYRWLRTAPGRL